MCILFSKNNLIQSIIFQIDQDVFHVYLLSALSQVWLLPSAHVIPRFRSDKN